MSDRTKNLRLCILGNLLGKNAGYVTTQGQIIAELFEKDGHDVISASSKLNRFFRLSEVITTIALNRRSIDIAIIEVYSGLGMVVADTASFLCKIFRIPTVMVLHGGNLPAFARRFPRWTLRVLKRADILTAPSPYLAQAMDAHGLNVRIVPNVVELSPEHFKLRSVIAPKLLWMRSFHPIYNPQMAIDAFAKVRRKREDATLVMAGVDKGLESAIKKSAQAAGVAESVRFPGFLDNESKVREFSNANIYLNTNRVDNTPVSVLEACAFGLPVIATRVGGISQMLSDCETGILVDDGDADQMATAISRLLDDADLTKRLSRNGAELASLSNWDSVRFLWQKIFDQLSPARTVISDDHVAAVSR